MEEAQDRIVEQQEDAETQEREAAEPYRAFDSKKELDTFL
jgi:hypothetical protein